MDVARHSGLQSPRRRRACSSPNRVKGCPGGTTERGSRLMPPTNATSPGLPASISQLFWWWQYSLAARSHRARKHEPRDRNMSSWRASPKKCASGDILCKGAQRQKRARTSRPRAACAIQYVEKASLLIRQPERRVEERHGHPDAVLGGINGLTDPPERRFAVDERPYPVSFAESDSYRTRRRGCVLPYGPTLWPLSTPRTVPVRSY